MDMNARKERLSVLREWLKQEGYAAYLQPMSDEFQGEYTPDYAQRLPWMSGFTGSAGFGIFLAEAIEGKQAILFVDGRYTIQAAQEVDSGDYLILNSSEHPPREWLAENITGKLAYDPWLLSAAQVKQYGAQMTPVEGNPIDALWSDQPAPPLEPIIAHPMEYAGRSAADKIADIVKTLQMREADAVLLTLPDGINWLLNIRGSDIPYNPLVLCYALLNQQGQVSLFMHQREIHNGIFDENVSVHPIDAITDHLKNYKTILCDPLRSAVIFQQLIQKAGAEMIETDDPTLALKAIKNDVEIEGIREAHKRDGIALTQFLDWLDEALPIGDITEISAANKLEECRKEVADELYRGPSFATISGSGPNGAIVHYRVDEQSNRVIGDGELYLVDSGAQYPDGTTDVTRTVVSGAPTDEMRTRFTQVLKGHIAIAAARFPEGTTGSQLDPLARQYLWTDGVDYEHGTGHGVGSYLCVHEGPQRISKRGGDVPLQAGMILSNEPGYYKTDEYGIRIENLVLVIEAGKTEKGTMLLEFETLTLAPIDERLINQSMLSKDEQKWLDDYHQRIRQNMAN